MPVSFAMFCKTLLVSVACAAALRRDDVGSNYQLPTVALAKGTRLYSCQPHELDPHRDLWTFIGFEYFGYCTVTLEAATKKMAEMGWQGEPEQIGEFDPQVSYAKVFEVVRPCEMVLVDGKNSSTLVERFGPSAVFQNAKTLDMPNWISQFKHAEIMSQIKQKDGVVQCDAGLDVAVFHGISSNDSSACIRPVERDRLPTAAEIADQQRLISSASCSRFT
ncbi:unnamed protein product [Effrenium voratum]|uniref:Uncharacterized protein n=1 Tax=Effrenium voratum TaxID=2562239 RepID=A0AA36JEI6_9DINO|nr:unnamed protein product [Effrenium voratum]